MIPYGVGDMVVCIYDGEWSANIPDLPVVIPMKGCVYTVREMFQNYWGDVYIRLVEILNSSPHNERYGEAAFCADLFRPVKKTSIEEFERIALNVPKVKQQEKV
jgi:hypothetical protein